MKYRIFEVRHANGNNKHLVVTCVFRQIQDIKLFHWNTRGDTLASRDYETSKSFAHQLNPGTEVTDIYWCLLEMFPPSAQVPVGIATQPSRAKAPYWCWTGIYLLKFIFKFLLLFLNLFLRTKSSLCGMDNKCRPSRLTSIIYHWNSNRTSPGDCPSKT